MNSIVDQEKLHKRELVVRVATLELLVGDLIHLLRQVAPEAVDTAALEAAVDRDGQMSRSMPDDAEQQRFRLHQVLDERTRRLRHKRFPSALAQRRFEPTD